MRLILFILLCLNLSAEEPVALWLTWQRSPDTTMVVHWLTSNEQPSDTLYFREKGNHEFQALEGDHALLPQESPYYVHCLELVDLKPDHYYEIRWDQTIYKFKTAPANLACPVRFVEGGDIYHGDIATVAKMNRVAAARDPLFAVCGGDLAYSCSGSNRNTEKWERWIQWLSCWGETMRAPDGRLIPMIPAIGNHEVKGRGLKTPSDAAFFYHLFALPENEGYRSIRFGDYLTLLVLDSGHTHAVSGEQRNWLEAALKNNNTTFRFPVYHVPAYPAHRSYSRPTSVDIRNQWVPLFEKYGVTAVFEHDDHLFKRTYPLKGGVRDPNGVLYLGDGAWGVIMPRPPKVSWYLARTASIRHIYLVTLSREGAKFDVLLEDGSVFESFTR